MSTRTTTKPGGLALAMPGRRKECGISIVKSEVTKDEEAGGCKLDQEELAKTQIGHR